MNVKVFGEEFECTKAVKDETKGEIILYDEAKEIFKAVGVSDFSELEGDFEEPEKSEMEVIKEVVDTLIITQLMGG